MSANIINRSINTYHCLCAHLVLASTFDLAKLPHRASPGLDNAIILPYPPPPQSGDESHDSDPGSEEENDEAAENAETTVQSLSLAEQGSDDAPTSSVSMPPPAVPTVANSKEKGKERKSRVDTSSLGFTALLSLSLDRKPCIVNREDGFEKRHLFRCQRCRLVVGYQLDDVHFSTKGKDGQERTDSEGRVVYILPGGLMSTEEMEGGKVFNEKEIILGGTQAV
jgi:hypothetical protein